MQASSHSRHELKKYVDDRDSLFGKLKPERGVVEIKPIDKDLSSFESSPQVRDYLEHYGQILLTNYRAFALWSWKDGKAVPGERYIVAACEAEFWDKVHTLRQNPKHPEHERLWQFLRRALLSTARIATPQDLATYLASYAREARARVEVAPLGTLEPVKKALSDALGVHFEGEKGVHFFQSTLIQTLFYGIFSAWVLWHEAHPKPGERFQWRLSAQHLGLPILRTLFIQLASDPKKIRALNLEEVLDWTEECLARVERNSFFARYDMGEAVQYFYEPFLAEFDPELRKDFGVWYTPPEIVRYMVGSVDRALRENFNLPDGLADPSVIVLDPCCGTGAYLVETLKLIRRRLVEGYGEAQAALKIREVAKHRLYGFELLPAPYVVSHLQIDLMLTRWGAELNHGKDERAGVFLTNALTGWVPVKHPKDQVLFSEFGKGVMFPRALFPKIKAREEFTQTGVYLLLGARDDGEGELLYIGEGDPVRPRMESHYANKDFWTRAVFFVGGDGRLNKAHVQYLESQLVQRAKAAKRVSLENGNNPTEPTLSEADRADMDVFLGNLLSMLPVLGIDAFEQPEKSPTISPRSILTCTGKGVVATGYEANEGFVVKAASFATSSEADYVIKQEPAIHRSREELLNRGVLVADGEHYRFTQDYAFTSPSLAAGVVLGRSTNGRTKWKNGAGKTLKELQESAE